MRINFVIFLFSALVAFHDSKAAEDLSCNKKSVDEYIRLGHSILTIEVGKPDGLLFPTAAKVALIKAAIKNYEKACECGEAYGCDKANFSKEAIRTLEARERDWTIQRIGWGLLMVLAFLSTIWAAKKRRKERR